jgi:hypothetical protein
MRKNRDRQKIDLEILADLDVLSFLKYLGFFEGGDSHLSAF